MVETAQTFPNHYWTLGPKASELSKGKTFLVNDTFIRIDGINYVNIQANVGRLERIKITTGSRVFDINRPLCKGYIVWQPKSYNGASMYPAPLEKRCMNQKELYEAESDHYFLRKTRANHDALWLEYYHEKDSFGETHAGAHLAAFNAALRQKREKYAKEHPNVNYREILSETFKEEAGAQFPPPN